MITSSVNSHCPEGRNKFNTLTPAEAKKLSRYLNRKQPTRTASVLHKPRAPPIVLNNLKFQPPPSINNDNNNSINHCQDQHQHNGLPSIASSTTNQKFPLASTRSSSSCSDHSFRHHRLSLNYGSSSNGGNNNNNTSNTTSYRHAFLTPNGNNNNITNGFKYNTIQHSPSSNNNNNTKYTTIHNHQSPNNSDSNLSFRSSLDVIDSAYGSDRLQTMSVDLGNPPQQYNHSTLNSNFKQQYQQSRLTSMDQEQKKSTDESFSSAQSYQSESCKLKNSLSMSTSKVFQNQISNIKKFFRHMPMRRSFISHDRKQNDSLYTQPDKGKKLEESISQLSLNRSHSPPVCPPPPRELKSMSYMESAVNYSNYDDFTRARNIQTSTLLRRTLKSTTTTPAEQRAEIGLPLEREDISESWQLTSLPVSYERNLTTVIEEKQNSTDNFDKNNSLLNHNNNGYNIYENTQLIKPPTKFDDNNSRTTTTTTTTEQLRRSSSSTNSSQSLTSMNAVDSALDLHQPVASSFKFSYAQPPNGYEYNSMSLQRNIGLPPRMPIPDSKQQPQGTSTGGSSNSSSLTNGTSEGEQSSNLSEMEQTNPSENAKYMSTMDTDADTTIISDTSTLNGDNQGNFSRCAELERTIESLKNKLLSKEKDLTDLQLKQWSSDYLIDQLRSTIGKLEKENAQLKAVIVRLNSVNLK